MGPLVPTSHSALFQVIWWFHLQLPHQIFITVLAVKVMSTGVYQIYRYHIESPSISLCILMLTTIQSCYSVSCSFCNVALVCSTRPQSGQDIKQFFLICPILTFFFSFSPNPASRTFVPRNSGSLDRVLDTISEQNPMWSLSVDPHFLSLEQVAA